MLPEVYFKPPEAANSRAHQGCIPTRTNRTGILASSCSLDQFTTSK
jgi:hypothetical protein